MKHFTINEFRCRCGCLMTAEASSNIERLADNRMKDMELAQLYVDQFEQNIADPLRLEVRELREEVKQLKDAIEVISDCPYRDNCPVRDKLRRE